MFIVIQPHFAACIELLTWLN